MEIQQKIESIFEEYSSYINTPTDILSHIFKKNKIYRKYLASHPIS